MKCRRNRGSTLAEFAVCFFILVLLIFFPLVDMVGLATTYFFALVLVDQQVHDASMLDYRLAQNVHGPVRAELPQAWLSSSLGAFANVDGAIETELDYTDGVQDEFGFDYKTVVVTTHLSVRPFVSCPFPLTVPGLNAPVPFVLRSQRLIEDPSNAPR